MQPSHRVLLEADATLESFHDCHVHGLQWRRDRFSFALRLQYILEWIGPDEVSNRYTLSIAEALLVFHVVDELDVSMKWGAALDAQIAQVQITASRPTPNGQLQRRFEIDFAAPDGLIVLWSTGYEVILLGEPVLSPVTSIALPDGE